VALGLRSSFYWSARHTDIGVSQKVFLQSVQRGIFRLTLTMSLKPLIACGEFILSLTSIGLISLLVQNVTLSLPLSKHVVQNGLSINPSGFEHCAIVLIGFESREENQLGIPAVTLVYGDYKTRFHRIVSLLFKQHMKFLVKINCYLILLFFPGSADLAQRTKDAFVMISSSFENYGQYMYFVVIHTSILTHERFISQEREERQPLFQFILPTNLNSSMGLPSMQASVELFTPCAARVIFNCGTETGDWKGGDVSLNRGLLNSLEKSLLQDACPVDWEINFEITYNQRKSAELTNKSPSLAENVVSMVVENLNYSLASEGKSISRRDYGTVERFFKPDDARVYLRSEVYPRRQPFAPDDLRLVYDTYRFFTRQATYNFLTCDGAKRFISFTFFLKPFQRDTWITAFYALGS